MAPPPPCMCCVFKVGRTCKYLDRDVFMVGSICKYLDLGLNCKTKEYYAIEKVPPPPIKYAIDRNYDEVEIDCSRCSVRHVINLDSGDKTDHRRSSRFFARELLIGRSPDAPSV